MCLRSNIFTAVSRAPCPLMDLLSDNFPFQAHVKTVLVAGGFSERRQSCQISHGEEQGSLTQKGRSSCLVSLHLSFQLRKMEP